MKQKIVEIWTNRTLAWFSWEDKFMIKYETELASESKLECADGMRQNIILKHYTCEIEKWKTR